MTIVTFCECDGCGDREPIRDGYDNPKQDPLDFVQFTMATRRSGGVDYSFSGHLCDQCLTDLRNAVDISKWPRKVLSSTILVIPRKDEP